MILFFIDRVVERFRLIFNEDYLHGGGWVG